MSNAALIHVICKAIDKVAMPLRRDFGEVERLQVSQKGTANFVSNADIRTEQMLMEELEKARKGWGFLVEEQTVEENPSCEFRFVIDPIDGTTNFIHALPYFCTSIAAQRRSKDGVFETFVGVIYDAIHDEMFIAAKGEGATVNRKKLRVSQREQHWLVSTAMPRESRYNLQAAQASIEAVTLEGATLRCSGAAALDLAYVAAGRFDGMWYHSLKPWDTEAGILMVEEAGGMVSKVLDAQGNAIENSLIASNKAIHARLKALVK